MAQARSSHCQCKREWVILGVEYGRARRRNSQSYRGSNAGGGQPRNVATDGLLSYPAAMKEIGNADRHEVGRRLNNRAENSHQPFRRRERAMQRFRSMKTLQNYNQRRAGASRVARPRGLMAAWVWRDSDRRASPGARELDYERGDDVLQIGRIDLAASRRYLLNSVPRKSLPGLLATIGFLLLQRIALPVLYWFSPDKPWGVLRPWTK